MGGYGRPDVCAISLLRLGWAGMHVPPFPEMGISAVIVLKSAPAGGGFPWATLIAAVVSAGAAIFAVWVTGRREDRNRDTDLRRDACEELASAARSLYDAHKQRSEMMRRREVNNAVAVELNRRTDDFVTLVRRAVIRVQMAAPGTPLATLADEINLAVPGEISSHIMAASFYRGQKTWAVVSSLPGADYFDDRLRKFVELAAQDIPYRHRSKFPRRHRRDKIQ